VPIEPSMSCRTASSRAANRREPWQRSTRNPRFRARINRFLQPSPMNRMHRFKSLLRKRSRRSYRLGRRRPPSAEFYDTRRVDIAAVKVSEIQLG